MSWNPVSINGSITDRWFEGLTLDNGFQSFYFCTRSVFWSKFKSSRIIAIRAGFYILRNTRDCFESCIKFLFWLSFLLIVRYFPVYCTAHSWPAFGITINVPDVYMRRYEVVLRGGLYITRGILDLKFFHVVLLLTEICQILTLFSLFGVFSIFAERIFFKNWKKKFVSCS